MELPILFRGRGSSPATPGCLQATSCHQWQQRWIVGVLLTGGAILSSFSLAGGRLQAEEPLQYNRDIRPILADHCFACHGSDSASREAGLRLDLREAPMETGVLVPGDAEASPLIERVLTDDVDLIMPPLESKKPLSDEQKRLLQQWVNQGAEYQAHWALIVPHKAALPAVTDKAWAKNDLDRFVLAKLEKEGLSPAPPADARTLFRRLHLDITGLPPTPEDVERFVSEFQRDEETAVAEWVDRLMMLPTWGEHRGRYWLDAARYGDTHGLHFDNYREMWPYRDWVIRAYNANLPFDQFTIDQLAGDLLADPTADQLIATGFQRCNITTNEGGTIAEENLAIYASDRVQTFGWVYLGLTTNCAQCHDHKFDPISMKDYYSLAAFFRNTTQPAFDGNVKDGRSSVLVVPSMEDRLRWQALPEEIEAGTTQRDAHRQSVEPQFQQWLASLTVEQLSAQLPSEGLLVHVPLSEGAGQAVCRTGDSTAPVTATGEVGWVPAGKLGDAPVFKPGATFELGAQGDFQREQSFSYGAWIKAANKTNNSAVFAKMDVAADFRGWDLYQAGGRLSVHLIDKWPSNALKVSTQREVLDPAQWQHVLVTYDGSGTAEGIQMFVNGQIEPLNVDTRTLTADASFDTETPLRVGQRSTGEVFDGGSVQDLRLYSRNLTDSEALVLATIAPLQSILAIPAAERSESQQKSLMEHYLAFEDEQYQQLSSSVTALEAEREAIRARSPVTHIQEEKKDSQPMAQLLMRGEYDRPGDEVAAATPASLHALPAGETNNRLGLAKWLTAADNPLTARVTVNRYWQQVFGQGIVPTAEDFGVMGMPPSNPELLDWLAVDFRENHWDVKHFFKQLFLSATYRQSAQATPDKLEKDPSNAWLSRGPRFRMDAEMVRDYALSASGLLADKMYGPGVKPYQPDKIWDMVGLPGGDTREYRQDQGEGLYRRTVYTFWKRMAPPPNLEAFNAPSREVCTVRRERTNTPLQALVTLNDPQFIEAARKLAERTLLDSELATAGDGAGNIESLIDQFSLRVLGRRLSLEEKSIVRNSYQQLLEYYRAHPDDAAALLAVGESPENEQLDRAPLAAWTMVGNQLMNLDEALCK